MIYKMFVCLAALATVANCKIIEDPKTTIFKHVSPNDVEEGVTYTFNTDSLTLSRDIDATNCTKPGPICGNCVDVYECVEIGGGFILIQIKSCNENETCQFSSGTCITNHNPLCPEISAYKFICYQIGLFPDAINCQKYHMCTQTNIDEKTSTELNCDADFYYDPKTTLCKKRLINGDCPDPIEDCEEVGYHGAVKGNPALYYICIKPTGSNAIFPQQYLCANDKEYDVSSKACVGNNLDSGVGSDGKCTAVGTFYVPSDCNAYNECSVVGGAPAKKTCAVNTYFNPKTKQCSTYTCADLDN